MEERMKSLNRVGGLAIVLSMWWVSGAVAQIQIGRYLTINGYSSFEYEKLLGDEGKGDPNGSFDADLFDLVLNITPTDRLRIASDITFEHGAASEDNRGNVAVEYAFGEYTVMNALRFRAGKMFTPFGIYNEIHTAKPAFLTVKEPLSTNKNHKFGSALRFYPRWATGLAVLGDGTLSGIDFDYIVQLSNGEQSFTNPYEEDDNKAKALSARLRFIPADGVQVGLSFYRDMLSTYIEDDQGELTVADEQIHLLSYGAQAEWNSGNFGVEFEYVFGFIDPESGVKISRDAFTAMVYYLIKDRFTPYVRYEYLNPNQDLDNDGANQFIYGVNINIDRGLFVKMEFNTVSAQRENQRFKGKAYTEFKAAVAIGF